MSLIPMDLPHIQQALLNDGAQMRVFLDWIHSRAIAYAAELTPTVMTAAGISTADQGLILGFLFDLNRLDTFVGGTLPNAASNIRVDVANILGVT